MQSPRRKHPIQGARLYAVILLFAVTFIFNLPG